MKRDILLDQFETCLASTHRLQKSLEEHYKEQTLTFRMDALSEVKKAYVLVRRAKSYLYGRKPRKEDRIGNVE
jgi:hypothetical protein